MNRGDDQVEVLSGSEKVDGLSRTCDVGDFGKMAEIEGLKLVIDELVEMPFLFEEGNKPRGA